MAGRIFGFSHMVWNKIWQVQMKWEYYTSSTEEGQWNGIRGLKKERKEGQWNGFQLLYWSRGIFFIWKSGKKLIIDVTCRPDVTFMGLLSYAVHALH